MKIVFVNLLTVLTVFRQIKQIACEYSLNAPISATDGEIREIDSSNEVHDLRHLKHRQKDVKDFMLVDFLSDGEQERRISFQGITAKETSLGNNSKSLSLWQLTDGRALIQMIYSDANELLDCEYIQQKSYVYEFVAKFYREFEIARARNFSAPARMSKPMSAMLSDHEFRDFVDNGVMTSEMDDFVDNLGPQYSEDAFGMRNLSYTELSDATQLPAGIAGLMDYQKLKEQCDARHTQMKKILHQINGDDEQEKEKAKDTLDRHKRAISDWIMPDTKWCGKGNLAKGVYSKLGGASRADMCCRKHDHCKMTIPGLTTKWHYFNVRPFTLSHCNCDLRFRTCLKMADSSDATLVGRLFFNIVKSKCFVLKREKVCKKLSWWGRCEKKGFRKRAHVRDNRKF